MSQVWIIEADGHFSVLFQPTLSVAGRIGPGGPSIQLLYYDGLAQQQQVASTLYIGHTAADELSVQLYTVHCVLSYLQPTLDFEFSSLSMSVTDYLDCLQPTLLSVSPVGTGQESTDDLVAGQGPTPPLERIIHTKWPGSLINWNGADKIPLHSLLSSAGIL